MGISLRGGLVLGLVGGVVIRGGFVVESVIVVAVIGEAVGGCLA